MCAQNPLVLPRGSGPTSVVAPDPPTFDIDRTGPVSIHRFESTRIPTAVGDEILQAFWLDKSVNAIRLAQAASDDGDVRIDVLKIWTVNGNAFLWCETSCGETQYAFIEVGDATDAQMREAVHPRLQEVIGAVRVVEDYIQNGPAVDFVLEFDEDEPEPEEDEDEELTDEEREAQAFGFLEDQTMGDPDRRYARLERLGIR